MAYPLGGAFPKSEEFLLSKVRVLEKRLEKRNQVLIATEKALEECKTNMLQMNLFLSAHIEHFRQKAAEKDEENRVLKERMKNIKRKIRRGEYNNEEDASDEEKKETKRKPGPKGRRPAYYDVDEGRDDGDEETTFLIRKEH